MGSSDRDLKASVDQMFQIVQEQAKKRDESDLLMQALASKLDIQGQRLCNLEKDVQSIKMTVTNNNSQATQPKSYTSNVSADYFDNQDKVSEFSQNITEVKCLVREEVRGLGNVCIKCSTDVIMKLDKADKTVFGPLVEATSDLKQVLQRMEDIDKGIRTIENMTNEYSETLKRVDRNQMSSEDQFWNFDHISSRLPDISKLTRYMIDVPNMNEMTTLLDKAMKKTGDKLNLCEWVGYENIMTKLDSISTKVEESRSVGSGSTNGAAVTLEQETGVCNFDKEFISRHSHLIIEQIVAENQINREILQRDRKPRGTYTCDFFVCDFSTNGGSQPVQFSNLWYIDQFNSHLKGKFIFNHDGSFTIRLIHGKNHCKLALEAKKVFCMGIKVTAVKKPNKNLWLDKQAIKFDEGLLSPEADCWLFDFGYEMGQSPSAELLKTGYIDEQDRLLLRFEITPAVK